MGMSEFYWRGNDSACSSLKSKVVFVQDVMAYFVKVHFHSFFKSAIDEDDWSTSHPGVCSPEKTPRLSVSCNKFSVLKVPKALQVRKNMTCLKSDLYHIRLLQI